MAKPADGTSPPTAHSRERYVQLKQTVFTLKKLFPLILVMLISCNEHSTTELSRIDSIKPKASPDSVTSNLKTNHLGVNFRLEVPFEIVSFHRGVTLAYSGPNDTSVCKKWEIEKENLYTIFKNSQPIDGTTWDLAFAFSTCIVEGQLKQKDQLFEYSLNAGSWFIITCRDTSLLFGDYNKKDRKFFLDYAERH